MVLNGTSGYNAALGASPGTNYGVYMSTDSDISSASATVGEAGNITINSVGEDTVLAGDTITSVAGNITINANTLNTTLDSISSTSGNITIAPYTASGSIGLGGGAGNLNLSDTELATISTTGRLIIGKSDTGTGDIDLDSWNWSSKLYSGIEIYGNDIDIGGMTMGTGNFLAHAMDNGVDTGDLNVSSGITRSVNGVATLDLRADQGITINANILANDANSDADGNPETSADSLNVILNADRDNDDNGLIATTGSNIATLGGYFVAGGGSGTVGGVNGILGDGDGTGADDDYAYIVGSGNALSLTTTNITTSGGHAVLNGFAFGAGTSDGISLDRSKVWTQSGDIIIKGRSTGNTANPKGLTLSGDLANRTAELVTTDGDIKIYATTTSAQAIYLWEDSQISTTDGDIEINAYTSGTTPSLGAGGATATNHITSTNGNVTLALDDANLAGIFSITAGKTLTIKGYDPSMSIGLGGGSGTLNLNDGELTKLVANKLVIGDALFGTGDIDLDSWDWSARNFSSVELYGNSIDIGGMTMGTGSFMAYAKDNGVDYGDINISANITRSVNGVSTLDLRADRNIVNSNGADIIASDTNSDADGNPVTDADSLNVILNADRNANQDGAVRLVNATVTTLGGDFVAGGGSGAVGGVNGIFGDGDGTGADDIAAWGNSLYLAGINFGTTSINTGAGNIYMTGQGYAGSTEIDADLSASGIRLLASSLITTGNGSINLHGTGGGTTASDINVGIFLRSTSTIQTANGGINIYGKGGSIGGNSHGLGFSGTGVNTITTNNGDINVRAEATDTTRPAIYSLSVNGGIFSTGTGDITLTALNSSITTGAAFTIGGNTAQGDIILDTDLINLGAGMNVQTTGDIFVTPRTASTTIGLGGGSGDLNLTDAELGYFNTTGRLIIGNSLLGTGDIDLNSWNWSSKNFSGIEIYGNDIDIGGMTMGAGNFLAHAMDNGVDYGDLNISANITRAVNGDATLDLRADHNVTNSGGADIIATDANSDGDGDPVTSADRLNVILNADRDGDQSGAISLTDSAITTLGGYFVAGGGSGTVGGANGILGDGDGTGADDVAAWGHSANTYGIDLYNTDTTTGAGEIILNGHGYNNAAGANNVAIRIYNGSELVSTSGKIYVTGTGGNGTQANYGLIIEAGSKISSNSGDIEVISIGSGTVQWNDGVVLDGAIESTGTAGITITATKGGGTGSSDLLMRGTSSLGGVSAAGAITVNVDTIDLVSTTSIRTSGDKIVKPRTASTSIGLGGGSGGLNLTDAELDVFNGTGKLIIGDALLGTGDVDLDSWNWFSKLFSVELYGNDIDIGGMTMGVGNFMAHAKDNGVDYGDLNISANITRSVNGDATLDLRADRNITNSNNAGITASDANSDADGNPVTSPDRLNIILNADRNANNDGAISLTSATITTLGGNFIAGGGSGTVGGVNGILGDGDGTGADDVMARAGASQASGIALTGNTINAGSGAIILSGRGYDNIAIAAHYGVNLTSSALSTTSGKIQINGKAGISSDNAYGVQVSGSNLSTTTGSINITGSANTTANIDSGVVVFGTSVIESTDSGTITLTGKDSTTGRNFAIGAGGINRIGNTNMTGNIEINADTIAFSDTDDTILTKGNTVVKATTASSTIGLGGGTGGLNLSDAELGSFNGTGKLIIGDAISGTGDVDLDSWNWSTKLFSGIEVYGNDIDIGGMTMGVGNFMAHAMDNGVDYGDLNISANITRAVNGDATLDLRADQNVTNSGGADIIATDANSDGDANPVTSPDRLNIVLNADRDGDQSGAVNLSGATVTTLGGNFIAGGGSGTVGGVDGILGNGDGTGADDTMAWGNSTHSSGVYIGGSSDISTGAGSIYISGHGRDDNTASSQHGLSLVSNARLSTTSGNIKVNAYGGISTNNSYGVNVNAATIATETGFIDIVAHSGAAPTGDSDFVIFNNSVLESTGSGSIRITGNSGAASNFNVGATGANRIGSATMTGDLEIIGNTIQINDTDNSIISQGNIYIKPLTHSQSIGLDGGTGDLNLTDSELSNFNGTGKLIIGNSGTGTGDIDLDSWDLSTKFFSVELYGNDIDIGGLTMGAGNFMAYARDNGVDYGDLNISANITRGVNGVATLDLRADRNITNSNGADIIASDANSDADGNPATSADSLNVILNADRNANNSGAIRLDNAAITTLGGYFAAGGGSGAIGGTNGILGDGDGTGADDVAAWGNAISDAGISLDTVDINTSAGSIYMKGRGYANSTQNVNTSSASGIRLVTASLQTTDAGEINLHGIAGGTTGSDFSIGVFLRGGTLIDTENGDINIYGKGSALGNNSHGIAFSNVGTNTVSTTDGNIDLQGEAGDPSTGSSSIYISSANGGITSDGAGDITITALNDEIRRALAGSFMIGGSSATGDISLIANTITISGMDIQTNGNMYIKAIDSTRSIGLGGGTGDLNLTDTELALFGGNGKLIIGDALLGTGDIDVDTWNFSSKSFDVELYGNDIYIGGLTMGTGDFMAYARDNGGDVADLTVSAAITRGAAGTSALDLRADRNITFDSAASITSTTGEIDVTIDSDYNNVGGGSIVYNASSIDTNGGDITIAGAAAIGADATWNARGGTLTTGGAITMGANDLTVIADNVALSGNITGNANSILTLKPYDNNRSIGLGGGAGGFNLTDAELAGLTVGHLVIGDAASGAGDIAIQSWSLSGKSYDVELYGRDMDINGMTMGAGSVTMIAGNDVTVSGAIGNSGAGGDLYVDVGNDFENTAGASAISLGSGGRFLIYIDDLSHITRGGMTTGNLFGRDYTNDDPTTISTSFGNRFVFDETPTLTITADDVTLGAYDAGYNSFTYSLSGLATGDTAASALNGGPAYGKTQLTPTTYRITPSTGTLVSELGYLIAFQNGTLTMPVDPGATPPPTPTPTPPPAVNLPPSVEHQIQLPQLLFSEGYQVITSANASFMSNNEGMLIQRKLDGFRVNTNEADAFMRMVTGGYLQIEQPVVDYYGLSSYESEEF